MFLYDTPAEREVIDENVRESLEEEIKERLLFQKGVLALLKDTDLFGSMVEKAIQDIDFVIERLSQIL